MKRNLFMMALATACLVAASIGRAVTAHVDRFVAFLISAVSPGPALAIDAGPGIGFAGHLTIVRDPRVERHEAGTSRRAAARHQ